jgi:hypothetical protein
MVKAEPSLALSVEILQVIERSTDREFMVERHHYQQGNGDV